MPFLFWVLITVWGIFPVLIFVSESIVCRKIAIANTVFYLIWVAVPITVLGGIIWFHAVTWLKFMSL